MPPESGDYEFFYSANDYFKFEIDSNLDGNIDPADWKKKNSSGEIEFPDLEEGKAYKTKVSFYESTGHAEINFSVSGPGIPWTGNLGNLFANQEPPTLSIEPVSASEREGKARFKINVDGDLPDVKLRVDYKVQGIQDSDFVRSGYTKISKEDKEHFLDIPLVDDDEYELGENIKVTLVPLPEDRWPNPNLYYSIDSENSSASQTIIDNDMQLSLEPANLTLTEGEEAKITLKITDGKGNEVPFQEDTTVKFNNTGSDDLWFESTIKVPKEVTSFPCLLYTSDAADD